MNPKPKSCKLTQKKVCKLYIWMNKNSWFSLTPERIKSGTGNNSSVYRHLLWKCKLVSCCLSMMLQYIPGSSPEEGRSSAALSSLVIGWCYWGGGALTHLAPPPLESLCDESVWGWGTGSLEKGSAEERQVEMERRDRTRRRRRRRWEWSRRRGQGLCGRMHL